MKRIITFIFLLFVSAQIAACARGTQHTAESIDAIRWHSVENSSGLSNQAPMLDCIRVKDCWAKNQRPDTVHLAESKEDIYIWANKDFFGKTTLFVVVDRPDKFTWDMLGFENSKGGWLVGVYGGSRTLMIGSIPIISQVWYTEAVTDSTIAYGMSDESWAVIVQPTSVEDFSYQVVEYYWK